MNFVYLKLISLTLLIHVATAHFFEDDSGNLMEGKSFLRGGDTHEVMVNAARLASHIESAKDRFDGVGVDEGSKVERARCVYPAEEYAKQDGTIVCKTINHTAGSVLATEDCLPDEEKVMKASGQVVCRKKRSVVVIHDCLPDEEKVIKASGQVICRKKRSVVVIHNCLPDEEKVVKANGRVVCRKKRSVVVIDDCLPGEEKVVKSNGIVVCRKKRMVVVIDDCLPGEERVVKANGKVVCRKKTNRKHTIVVPRKGPKKNKTTTRIVSDDDRDVVGYDDDRIRRKKNVIVEPSRKEHGGRSGVIHVLDDDGVIIRPGPSGGCDDEDPFHQAVAGNGNQLYGSDCTSSKRSCMPPMTCQYSGNCQWTCKT